MPVTWCGAGVLQSATDRKPDLNAGPEVHVIYAHATGQPDRIGTFGDSIASDAASTDAWWRAQDATRTIRYDLFAFPGCSGFGRLDISDVTLAHDANYFQPLILGSDRYDRVVGDLGAFQSPYKKYVVYYDGPVASPNVCGEGGGVFGTGPNYAIVYLQACSLETQSIGYRAHVATHELIHSLGAVASGAPNECAAPNQGHVCDSMLDIMYWQAQPTTTLDTDLLDLNHNDYYGTGGAEDIRKSQWLTQLDVAHPASTVTVTGNGAVASDKPGIDCPGLCSNTWDQGSTFVLSATPAASTRFAGWSGACSGMSTCSVTMDAAKSVTATFLTQVPVTVAVDASRGSGTVVSEPAGLRCPGTCTASFDAGQVVKLVAQPGSGSRLEQWGGACSGRGACSITAGDASTVSATFGRANRILSVSVSGRGTVVSKPAGVSCPRRCTQSLAADTRVSLRAVPAKGYVLGGWSGACRGRGACTVTLTDDLSVRATFEKR